MGRRNYIHQADRFFNALGVNTSSGRPVIDVREPVGDGNTGVVQTNIDRTGRGEYVPPSIGRGEYVPPIQGGTGRGQYTGTPVDEGTGRGQYTPPVEGGTGTGTGTEGSPEPPPTPPEDPIIPDVPNSPETPDVPTPPIVNIVNNPSIPSGGFGGGGSMGGGSSASTPIQKKSWIPLILAVGGIAVMILKPIK